MLVEVLAQPMMHIILAVWEVTQGIFLLKGAVLMVNGVREAVMAYKAVQFGLQMVSQILEAVEAEAKVEVLVLLMGKDQVMAVQGS